MTSAASTSGWVAFWDTAPPIYSSDRHKAVHYALVADGIAAHLPHGSANVLDYGSGEALSAEALARRCGRLYLADAAPSVSVGLGQRFAGSDRITIVPHDDLAAAISPGTLDLVAVNSLAQYLQSDELDVLTMRLRPLLSGTGVILFADIIPRDVDALRDAGSLLAFAARNGFFLAATGGLVRTAMSNYPALRNRLGLTRYDEREFIAKIDRLGFTCERVRPNLGHNQSRMAFHARVRAEA